MTEEKSTKPQEAEFPPEVRKALRGIADEMISRMIEEILEIREVLYSIADERLREISEEKPEIHEAIRRIVEERGRPEAEKPTKYAKEAVPPEIREALRRSVDEMVLNMIKVTEGRDRPKGAANRPNAQPGEPTADCDY